MKRLFLMACFAGMTPLASLSVQAQLPAYGAGASPAGVMPTQPAMEVSEEALAPAGYGSRFSGWFGKRTAPAEAYATEGIVVGPGSCVSGGSRSTGECWDKFKNWFCYRSDSGKLLPCLQPTAYRPPLYNWFPAQEGCAPGCGAYGCGGPPITYYYPSKEHPAPAQPKIELRAPQPRDPNRGLVQTPPPAVSSPLLPGYRFASSAATTAPDRKRSPSVIPAGASVPPSADSAIRPAAARPGEPPLGFYPSLPTKPAYQP